jgi:hypothetical protein
MRKILLLFFLTLTFSCSQDHIISSDVCIYGGTSAAVTCAVQLAADGKTVTIIEPSGHIGGMSVEGLGGSDINNHREFKNDHVIGGLTLDFYKQAARHYGIENFESVRSNYMTWRFESSVAEEIFQKWLQNDKIRIFRNTRLILDSSAVLKKNGKIKSIKTTDGRIFKAKVFIDATYEGDLIKYSGISYVVGRESNDTYNETKNGIRWKNTYRQFTVDVDPYIITGDSTSGIIHTVQNETLRKQDAGKGDHRIQAFCFRACLTKDSLNRVPFVKPDNYNREWYEIYLRYIKAGGNLYSPNYSIPNHKTDLGAWHDLSHNLYGMNHEYPEADYEKREEIYRYHLDFTRGLFWFLSNDPEVPEDVRNRWGEWGTTKDEFTDNNGWPRQIYIREGRRMISDYVITENHTRRDTNIKVAEPAGIAFWPPDVHHVRRIIKNGKVYNEGFVFGGDNWKPFQISYRSMIPKENECINLITPTCLSSSHIGYGAIRLEWTFMILGQSAAIAANLSIEENVPVQDIDLNSLNERLLNAGQVLTIENQ